MKRKRVIIIGGGPAGSSAATILAKAGLDVTVLEATQFPRYHVGESLLPSAIEFLKALGAYDKVKSAEFIKKQGAYFQWGNNPEPWSVTFGDLRQDDLTTFQVERETFDHLLLQHAEQSGAQVIYQAKVTAMEFKEDHICSLTWEKGSQCHQEQPDYVIDASGSRGIIANDYLKSRMNHETFKNVALWGYWQNAKSLPEGLEGAVTTAAFDRGWIWGIPLKNKGFSVGVVTHVDEFKAHAGNRQDFYHDCIQSSPLMSDLLENAQLNSKLRFERDFSYWSQKVAGNNYYICGDAACFIDPILSSGIHLAMLSSFSAAACIKAQTQNVMNSSEAIKYYETFYNQSFLRFLTFVASFYQRNQFKNDFFKLATEVLNEHSSEDLSSAFLNLISGQKDIDSLKNSPVTHIAEEMKGRISENLTMRSTAESKEKFINTEVAQKNMNFFQSIEGLQAFDEKIEGFHIKLYPEVCIQRNESIAQQKIQETLLAKEEDQESEEETELERLSA